MFWPCNYAPKCSEPHKCVSKIPSVPHKYRNITIAYDITIVYDITIGVLDDATFTSIVYIFTDDTTLGILKLNDEVME